MLGKLQSQTGQLDQAVHLLAEAIGCAPETWMLILSWDRFTRTGVNIRLSLQIYRIAMQVASNGLPGFLSKRRHPARQQRLFAGSKSLLRRAAELAPDNFSIRRRLVGVITLNLVP